MLITKYKFNSTINTLPTFNTGYTYTYSDVDNGDGTITRTIESDTLPTSASFNGNLGITHLYYFNTTELTTMANMFRQCEKLQYVDFSHFRGEKVTSMTYMLYRCYELAYVDFSNFNAISLKDMSYMFCFDDKLPSINFDNFNAQKIENLSRTFHGCNALEYLDLSSFNGENLKITAYTFTGTFKWLDLSNFNTSNITDSAFMFNGVNSVKKIKFLNCTPESVSYMVNLLPTRKENTKGYIFVRQECPNEKYWENVICKDETISISLPQSLNKIGDLKDKLYWDRKKGHYCIEQNIGKMIATPNNVSISQYHRGGNYLTFQMPLSKDEMITGNTIQTNSYNIKTTEYANIANKNYEYITFGGVGITVRIESTKASNTTELREYVQSNPLIVLYKLKDKKIIDLPDLNEKLYTETTGVRCLTQDKASSSNLTLETDVANYQTPELKNKTVYTTQFNCIKESDENITFNLGGATVETKATIGTHHLTITTPSSISEKELIISGKNSTISDVMIFEEEEMNQYPNYFEGVQSVGVLQDSKYKINVISSNESTNVGNDVFAGYDISPFDTGIAVNMNLTMQFSLKHINDGAVIKNPNNGFDLSVEGGMLKINNFNFDEGFATKTIGEASTQDMIAICFNVTSGIMNIYKNSSFLFSLKYSLDGGEIKVLKDIAYLRITSELLSSSELLPCVPKRFMLIVNSKSPLAKGDKLYWNNTNKRYEIDRNGEIEVPTVIGDVIDSPRLYQREDTTLVVESGNIKPSEIKIEYLDIN